MDQARHPWGTAGQARGRPGMGETAWATGAVVVDGVRLNYHRTGGDGKPVLVLLHGITDDGLCWTRVARDLEADHDIVKIGRASCRERV